ncbi:hypothetical protein [Marinobacter sp. F3R11]|uniref:hypothetical protein n=1 Tax=Marinobacter sp. F3R11 TaxID=2267231 RepID=UPI0021C97CDD|nr:hypothetical protein [Marinobacter sp. F3R11]
MTPVTIEYEGTTVSYQHQLWRLRPVSVCANYRHNLSEFSPCTVKAAQLFNALCMEVARQARNAATVAAMGNSDPRLARERDKTCEAYRSMKAGT